MADSGTELETKTDTSPLKSGVAVRRWLLWSGVTLLILLVALAITAGYMARHAEPLLRQRVVENLQQRFHSPVELDELHLSLVHGVEVSGGGLRILQIAGPEQPDKHPERGTPMLTVRHFDFHTGVREIFEPTMRVVNVNVDGMELRIPPKQLRPGWMGGEESKTQSQPKMSLLVDRIVCRDARVVIETSVVGKPSLVFDIHSVYLRDVGPTRPLEFDALLTNPKPVGDIRALGHFGPWHPAEPRETPIDGHYAFTNANMSTIKGLHGTLSSMGSFSGVLGEIAAHGTTDIPDFALDVSEHPVALHTEFDATIDGTTGDTTLKQVHATFLHTALLANGSVVRYHLPQQTSQSPTQTAGVFPGDNPQRVPGHDIELMVESDHARIEDLLQLGMKTSPPLVRGAMRLKTKLSIKPGPESVTRKMHLDGTFAISGATFTNARWQEMVDTLSERAQGRPKLANPRDAQMVASEMQGHFSLANAQVHVPEMQFRMPGAEVKMAGDYGLDGERFEFAGTVRTQATASQMLTGWKSLLAKPFDSMLKKNGAGMEIPVKVSGTRADPKFGVDLDKMGLGFLMGNKDQAAPPVGGKE